MSKTTREIEARKNRNMLVLSIIGYVLICGFLFFMYEESKCHYETETIKLTVGCALGGYPTHSNMICESGIYGDVENAYGGIIWYCGGYNETKTCMYKETKKVCK